MLLSNTTALFILLSLMVGSLVLVRLIQERQERNLVRLYRLAALDRRSSAISTVIQNLKELDDNPEVVRLLGQTLKSDLQRIQTLDPARGNFEKEMRLVSSGGGDSAKADKSGNADSKRSKIDSRTSLKSEREVIRARAHINDALVLLRHLYQGGKISGEALESTARQLGLLSALVGVNSNIHMAELAISHADITKALSHFRAAESYLHNGPLKGGEGAEKLKLIQTRKQQILNSPAREGGEQEYYTDRAA